MFVKLFFFKFYLIYKIINCAHNLFFRYYFYALKGYQFYINIGNLKNSKKCINIGIKLINRLLDK